MSELQARDEVPKWGQLDRELLPYIPRRKYRRFFSIAITGLVLPFINHSKQHSLPFCYAVYIKAHTLKYRDVHRNQSHANTS